MSGSRIKVGQVTSGLGMSGRDPVMAGDLIGAALREHFEDVALAPVPDKFLLLLAQLEAKEEATFEDQTSASKQQFGKQE